MILASCALLLTSCNLDVDQIYLGGDRLLTNMQGGSYNTTVYATGAWTSSVSAPDGMKVTITPNSGTGIIPVTITVAPYEGEEDALLAYMQFNCGKAITSVPVIQATDEYIKELQNAQGSN